MVGAILSCILVSGSCSTALGSERYCELYKSEYKRADGDPFSAEP